jgi:hypothetical protein
VGKSWSIDQGNIDASLFFEALAKYFPHATTLYVEGTSIDADVKHCLIRHSENGKHLPGRQTLWPKSDLFRCKFSAQLGAELSVLAARLAQPELCDHLSLFRDEEALLEFHDFGANAIYISGGISERDVSSFAMELSLEHHGHDDG